MVAWETQRGGKAIFSVDDFWRKAMQFAITLIAVIAGLVFSLAIALLVEELIFGKVFRLLFARQAARVKSGQER
jgi:ABC-type sugar transport system permease subunit